MIVMMVIAPALAASHAASSALMLFSVTHIHPIFSMLLFKPCGVTVIGSGILIFRVKYVATTKSNKSKSNARSSGSFFT